MSTLETINNKNFLIKFRDGVQNSSFTCTNLGCKWTVSATSGGFGRLGLYIKCEVNNTNLWNVNADVTFTLFKNNGKEGSVARKIHAKFNSDKKMSGFEDFMPTYELSSGYRSDNMLTLQVLVEIIQITGIPRKTISNYNNEDDKLNDVALIVEGKKLYANKAVLATFSPVFRAMFFSEFKESTDKEVIIKDAEYEDFKQFLQAIHSSYTDINKDRIRNILILADRYDVVTVMEKCETYLNSNDDVTIGDKLEFAEKYVFPKLYENCLASIDNEAKLKTAYCYADQMGPYALRALIKKSSYYF